MESEPEVIRDQMQETRTALTEKLEALEQKVVNKVEKATETVTETVHSVTEAVQGTVDTVSDTVGKTVETVKDTFDIAAHVERHPFAMMAGSVAAGFFLGRLLTPRGGGSSGEPPQKGSWAGPSWPEAIKQSASGADEERRREGKEDAHAGIIGGLLGAMGQEVDKLKDLGIAALFGVMRDLLTQQVPGEVGSRLKDWVNGLTEKMGAKPIKEPLLSTPQQQDEQQQPQQQHKPDRAPAGITSSPTGQPPSRR